MPGDKDLPASRLVTPRLVLRRWDAGRDLDAYAEVCADPEVMRYIGDGATFDRARTAQAIAAYEAGFERNGFGLFAAERRDTGALAGFVGLAVPEFLPEVMPAVEIGWRLGRAHWGEGLSTEGARAVLAWAFDERGLGRVVSIHQVGNEASANVMRKLGMTLDRATVERNVDRAVHVYAITRREHEAHTARRRRALHRQALDRFTAAAAGADARGAWDAPSPCSEWSARDVVEHVIGFHDVLLLRPLGVRAHRPRTGTTGRLAATIAAVERVLAADGPAGAAHDPGAGVPAAGEPPDLEQLLPILTADVTVHAWDVERATGGDEALPPELVVASLAAVEPNVDRLAPSGMFAPPVPAPAGDLAARLLAVTGRNVSRRSV